MVPTSTTVGAALQHDVGDAKAVADLHELAAADEHLAAAGGGGDGEQHRGGVVVDDERVLGAGDGAERVVDVVLARGALPAHQAVLEVRVAGGGRDDRVHGLLRQHGAAEVGVHDDPGRVDDAAQRRSDRRLEQPRRPRHEIGRREVRRPGGGRLAGLPAREDLGAQPLDDGAHGVGHEGARVALEQHLRGRLAQDLVDGRQGAQPCLAAFAVGAGLRLSAGLGLAALLAVHHESLVLPARCARMRSPATIIANATTAKPNHQSVAFSPIESSHWCRARST